MKRARRTEGFTLVELLVAVAILGTVAVVAMVAIGSALKASAGSNVALRSVLTVDESLSTVLLVPAPDHGASFPSTETAAALWSVLMGEEQSRLQMYAAGGKGSEPLYEQFVLLKEHSP